MIMKRPKWLLILGIVTAIILLTGGISKMQKNKQINTEGVKDIAVQKAAESTKTIMLKPIWEVAKGIINIYE